MRRAYEEKYNHGSIPEGITEEINTNIVSHRKDCGTTVNIAPKKPRPRMLSPFFIYNITHTKGKRGSK